MHYFQSEYKYDLNDNKKIKPNYLESNKNKNKKDKVKKEQIITNLKIKKDFDFNKYNLAYSK